MDIEGGRYASIMRVRDTETQKEYLYSLPFRAESKEGEAEEDNDGTEKRKEERGQNMIGIASLFSTDARKKEE